MDEAPAVLSDAITEASNREGRRYAANIPRFYAFWALINFFFWLPIFIVFFLERGLSYGQLGVLEAAGMLVMAIAEVLTGAVADVYGRKVSMAIGAFVYAFSMLAVLTEVLSPLFVLGFILWGVSFTFISGADMAFLYDSLKADGRTDEHPKVAGRYTAVAHASAAVAGLSGAALAVYDMRLCFAAAAACGVLALFLALTFREPPRDDDREKSAAASGYWQTLTTGVRIAVQRPLVRYQVLVGGMVPAFSFIAVYILLQPYSTGAGLPLWSLGPLVLATRAAAVAASLAAGRISAHFDPWRVVVVGVAALIGGQAFLASAEVGPAVLAFVIIAAASAIVLPMLSALLNRELPSAQRATVLSVQGLVWTVTVAVVEPPLMVVAGSAGPAAALGVSAAVVALISIPLLALWRRSAVVAPVAA